MIPGALWCWFVGRRRGGLLRRAGYARPESPMDWDEDEGEDVGVELVAVMPRRGEAPAWWDGAKPRFKGN